MKPNLYSLTNNRDIIELTHVAVEIIFTFDTSSSLLLIDCYESNDDDDDDDDDKNDV